MDGKVLTRSSIRSFAEIRLPAEQLASKDNPIQSKLASHCILLSRFVLAQNNVLQSRSLHVSLAKDNCCMLFVTVRVVHDTIVGCRSFLVYHNSLRVFIHQLRRARSVRGEYQDLGMSSSPSCSARPWLVGALHCTVGLSEGASVSKFNPLRAKRLGVFAMLGVRPPH
jgi:hypothetical protein